MKEPSWARVHYPKIDYQAAYYYAAPKNTPLKQSLDEVDPKLLETYKKLGIPLSEQMALAGAEIADIEAKLAQALAAARPRDAAAGRALTGPHRGDLAVLHAEKDRPAAEGSTGEQKALILNLVLAQSARLSRAESSPRPILLLDEVAAHLDRFRRAALFDEIEALGLQAFLTGTDEHLFEDLKGRAQGVRVDASGLTQLDTE